MMMMMTKKQRFVTWEEHIVCNERGRRVVHYYLKKATGEYVLAVIGTEKSIRHMLYVVSDEFLETCGSNASINACTRWRARREVVNWLGSLLTKSKFSYLLSDETTEALSLNGISAPQIDQMVPRKLTGQNSRIEWSGVPWICGKQLKHYTAFYRNGIAVSVHSFVYVLALEKHYYLGYVEDMYEDRKGKKKVKVRWFHHSAEVDDVIPDLNPHQREVFITPHVQVISAKCIDGPATVLTPKHYEKCLVSGAHTCGVHMCYRQFKDHEVRPFNLAKLRGYSSQAILSSLQFPQDSKEVVKCHMLYNRDEEEQTLGDPLRRVYRERNISYEEHQGHALGYLGIGNLRTESQLKRCVPTYPNLKIKLSRKAVGVDVVDSDLQYPVSYKVDEKIELLCQDSGIQGCWFRCKVLQTSQKRLKLQYDDLQDVDESGNLEEWVPAFRVASPDNLGMRCSGRLTIRPCQPNESAMFSINVGVPVDAWWCDGWWEGVIVGTDVSGTAIQVYFPGEGKLLNFQRQNLRASRDWIDNEWIDVKARSDILLHIPENVRCSIKSIKSSPCTSPLAEWCYSKVRTSPKCEVCEEKPKLSNLDPMGDERENEKGVDLKKQLCNSKGKNDESSKSCTCSKDDFIFEEQVDPAYETCQIPQSMEVAAQS